MVRGAAAVALSQLCHRLRSGLPDTAMGDGESYKGQKMDNYWDLDLGLESLAGGK